MNEWQIIESDSFPDLPPEESPPPAWRRQVWGWLAGALLLLLLLLGWLMLRERRAMSQAALHQDLSAAIFEEETRRFLGQPDEAFIDPVASLAWQRAYWRTFEGATRPVSPGEAQLATVDYFDGNCAVVTVTGPAGKPHRDPVRAFCLEAQGWRRTPIPPAAWGEEQPVIILSDGITIRFQARDRVFAKRLAQELTIFFSQVEQLPVWSPAADYHDLEIIVAPYDLQGPLALAGARQIVLNSPLLLTDETVEVSETSTVSVSGETTVRLALAVTLLRRADMIPIEATPTLPGVERFVAAIQTVTAMRLLFSPETEAALLAVWRDRLGGGWVSPFFAELLPMQTVKVPETAEISKPSAVLDAQAEAAALLTVDYIYRLNGLDALPLMRDLLADTSSWDAVFQTLLGRSTLALELEAARYARADKAILAALSRDYSLFVPPLPLTATLHTVDQVSQVRRLVVTLPNRSEPLLVELSPEAVFETGEGLPLEPSCLGPGAELELYGKWLEISRRLQARQLIVNPGAPISLQPAPADSLAYLIIDSPPEELKKLAVPDPRIYPVAGGFTQLVVALRPDQTLQPLFRLTPELKLFPLPIGAGEPVHFLVQIDLPRCERHWLGRYEPARGLSGQWFTPQFRMQWVWQADRAAPLFFKRSQDRQSYQIYEAGQVTTFHQPGFSDAPIWFMGWHMPTRQVIPVRFQLGKDNVALLNPGSGQISLVGQPPFHALQRHGLSPDGNWLAYPAGMPNLSKPPTRFELLNLANGSETDLLQLEVDEELRSFAWSPYLSQPLLVILTGSLDGHTPPSSRLLLVRPDRPGQAFELASDIALAEPVFCSDGSLLYRAGQEARYQLLKQHPGQPAETLLTLDHPFKLLACP